MKKTLYPKTIRINNDKIVITEKLDWSNLWIFNLNWKLIIAQRNNIFQLSELNKVNSYKWLVGWIEKNKEHLNFHEWSWVFWEWIWMWKIWYWNTLDKRFYLFCKANINNNYDIRNINYNLELLKYSFTNSEVPKFIWIVPIIPIIPIIPFNEIINIDSLDILYDNYTKSIKRHCEWFIINNGNSIKKYVRYKNGKLTEHKS